MMGPRHTVAGGSRSRLLLALVLVIGVVVAGVATFGWVRDRTQTQRLTAQLPSDPPEGLDDWPDVFNERIRDAHTTLRSGSPEPLAVARLGRLYHANGFLEEAAACWRWLRHRQPREGRWPYYLADLHRLRGDYEAYEKALAETVRRAPDYAAAWLQLGDLQLKTNRPEAARASYQQRLKLRPNDPYARLGLARLNLLSGNRAEARQQVEQIVADTSDFATAHNLHAEMLAAAGDTAGARLARWRGNEAGRYRDPEDPWREELIEACYDPAMLLLYAKVQHETRQGDRGVALARRAIELSPTDPSGYEVLADLYLKHGDARQAVRVVEEGRQRAPESAHSLLMYVHLSQALRQLGRPEEALRVAEEGRRAVGDAYELWDATGVALAELKRFEEAVAALRRAIEGNPNDPIAYYHLGLALMSASRPEEAQAAVKQAIAVKPTFAPALTLLARVELEAGRWQEAARYLEPLYETLPGVPAVQQMVAQWRLRAGWAAEMNNAPAEAEAHYEAGLTAAPQEPDLHLSLGFMRLMQGRVVDALEPLQTHHRLRPEHAEGALFLGQAYAQLGRQAEAVEQIRRALQAAERSGDRTTANLCREILRQL